MGIGEFLGIVLFAAGALMLAAGARAWSVRAQGRRHGRLVSVDIGEGAGWTLVSYRYHLTGRPDAVRSRADGARVPVEVKSRTTPSGGPTPSHRVQVEAYCLLIEETTGRPPPYGVLQFADGGEFTIPWDGRARSEVSRLLREVSAPYDGRATPSRGKCLACRWRPGCDARAA